MNWAEFFDMGGYAFYVWSAWGLTTLVLGWQFAQPKLAHAKIKRELKRQISRELLSKQQFSNPQASNEQV
jgi:heme exporter protein D